MNNKKGFIVTDILMLALVLLPTQSISGLIDSTTKNVSISNMYVSSQYKPYIPHFGNFSIHQAKVKTGNPVGHYKSSVLDIDSELKLDINLKFQHNTTGFSGVVGYASESLRLESEASYGEFDIKILDDSFATRTMSFKDHDIHKNNKLSIASVMVNTCYDISIANLSATPYLCTGIGGDFIRFFNTTYLKFAYQGKIGVSYQINNSILLFADTYYHKVIGDEFKNLYIQHTTSLNSSEVTPALANLNIGYFGTEIGVRLIFNKS